MAEFFLGQIMLTGFNFAQKQFALCNGQTMSVSQNQALFSLLGITYGGNGTTTFLLPNLQGRTPVGQGASVDGSWQPAPYAQGTAAGVENVTLLTGNLPQHTHTVSANTQNGTVKNPTGALYATATAEQIYGPSNGALVGSILHRSVKPAAINRIRTCSRFV